MKAIIFDVDGTLTDGKIYMGNDGEVLKKFDIKDGCGIHDIMPKHNIIPIVITARQSQIVNFRCRELKIQHCYQGCRNKVEKLHEIAKQLELKQNNEGKYKDIAYMGDDLIDIPIMNLCEFVGCPNDAVLEVRKIAHFISTKKGGDGAAREFIEWIVANKV